VASEIDENFNIAVIPGSEPSGEREHNGLVAQRIKKTGHRTDAEPSGRPFFREFDLHGVAIAFGRARLRTKRADGDSHARCGGNVANFRGLSRDRCKFRIRNPRQRFLAILRELSDSCCSVAATTPALKGLAAASVPADCSRKSASEIVKALSFLRWNAIQ
jgi:hypothetical protein